MINNENAKLIYQSLNPEVSKYIFPKGISEFLGIMDSLNQLTNEEFEVKDLTRIYAKYYYSVIKFEPNIIIDSIKEDNLFKLSDETIYLIVAYMKIHNSSKDFFITSDDSFLRIRKQVSQFREHENHVSDTLSAKNKKLDSERQFVRIRENTITDVDESSSASEGGYCTYCGHNIRDNALFCDKCGNKVETIQSVELCFNCGSKTSKHSNYCHKCGFEMKNVLNGDGNIIKSFGNGRGLKYFNFVYRIFPLAAFLVIAGNIYGAVANKDIMFTYAYAFMYSLPLIQSIFSMSLMIVILFFWIRRDKDKYARNLIFINIGLTLFESVKFVFNLIFVFESSSLFVETIAFLLVISINILIVLYLNKRVANPIIRFPL